jgi:hypothetical protein
MTFSHQQENEMFGRLLSYFRRQQTISVPSGPFGPGRPTYIRPPGATPGHYRIISKETGDLEYYGTTNNLARRRDEHRRSRSYDPASHYFAWQAARDGAGYELLREYEKRKIEQHRPPRNKRAGGAGPRW